MEFQFVVVKTLQKALTRQISEAVRTRQRGEDLIINKKCVFNLCVVPELAVKFKSKMCEEEKRKFEPTPDCAETGHCLEDMIAAREEDKKRKKEILEVKAGKRRKKEVWFGNQGEVAWGETGSAENGKTRRKLLYEQGEGSLEPGQDRVMRKLNQRLLIPFTENEMLARQILIQLARKFEEEKEWTVELEDKDDCDDLLSNEYERARPRGTYEPKPNPE